MIDGLRYRGTKSPSDSSENSPPPADVAELSEQDAFERELLAMWLESNIEANSTRCAFYSMPATTWSSTRAVFRLLRKSRFTLPILRRVTQDLEARLVALFIGQMVLEFCSLVKVYLHSLLLDLLHRNLASESRPGAHHVFGVTVFDTLVRSMEEVIGRTHHSSRALIQSRISEGFKMNLIASSALLSVDILETVLSRWHNKNRALLKLRIEHNFERDRVLSWTCLSLRLRTSPTVRSLEEGAKFQSIGYFQAIEYGLHRIPARLAALVTQVSILVRVTFSGSGPLGWREWLIRGLLIFVPMFLHRLVLKMWRAENKLRKTRPHSYLGSPDSLSFILSGDPKELVVFGCRSWILSKMEGEFKEKLARLGDGPDRRAVLLSMGGHIVHTITDKLLESVVNSQMLSFKPSIGAITMSQKMMKGVWYECAQIQQHFRSVHASVFNFAAYLLVIRMSDHPAWVETLLAARQSGVGNLASSAAPRSSLAARAPEESDVSDHRRIDYDSVRTGGMCIEARNLGFQYPDATKPTLKGINLRIEAGETIAIVGYNGGGKSTLLEVLLGLWGEPNQGQLLINGIPIEQYDPNSIRARISCLFQDFRRYNESLRVNLGLKAEADLQDDEELKTALSNGGGGAILDKVGLDGRLHRFSVEPDLPKPTSWRPAQKKSSALGPTPKKAASSSLGVEVESSEEDEHAPSLCRVGKRKVKSALEAIAFTLLRDKTKQAQKPHLASVKNTGLSGGQWQRVALARAFYYSERADLVAFDEPSAALDPKAEIDLFHWIHKLSSVGDRKRTTIYISHRFSTVRKADKIAVVENGTLIEFGPHAELMQLKGRYHELLTLQRNEWAD